MTSGTMALMNVLTKTILKFQITLLVPQMFISLLTNFFHCQFSYMGGDFYKQTLLQSR